MNRTILIVAHNKELMDLTSKVKGIVHPEQKILKTFLMVPSSYDFPSFVEHKIKYLEGCYSNFNPL